MAKSPADVLYGADRRQSAWLLPLFRTALQRDPVKDFAPLTLAVSSPSMLVYIRRCRSGRSRIDRWARPDRTAQLCRVGHDRRDASSRGGIIQSDGGRQYRARTHKGSGPALIGLMSGEVEFMLPGAASAWGFVKQGRLRAPLGICALHPSALFPGVPTVSASGMPGYHQCRQGVVAPARTPVRSQLTRLNQNSCGLQSARGQRKAQQRWNRNRRQLAGGICSQHEIRYRQDEQADQGCQYSQRITPPGFRCFATPERLRNSAQFTFDLPQPLL